MMIDMEKQILDTWRINHKVNLRILDNISDEALHATLSTRGGRNVARQFAHMHAVRIARLESFARKSGKKLAGFEKGETPGRQELRQALEESGKMMEEYLRCAVEHGSVPSVFRRGLIPLLGYFISHEAHHRGSILLTLKQTGHTLPDALKWGIWDWDKI